MHICGRNGPNNGVVREGGRSWLSFDVGVEVDREGATARVVEARVVGDRKLGCAPGGGPAVDQEGLGLGKRASSGLGT